MDEPLDSRSQTPRTHFDLYRHAGVLALLSELGPQVQLPMLEHYRAAVERAGGGDPAGWAAEILDWEERTEERLPLRDLRYAGQLSHDDLVLLFVIGLVEEDPRFAELFEQLQGPGHPRPTLGLLKALAPRDDVRRSLRRLRALGLVVVANPDEPRLGWELTVAPSVWDALRGEEDPELGSWAHLRPVAELPRVEELILPAALAQTLARMPETLAIGEASTVIVRGRDGAGRRTVAGALASALGLATLELTWPPDERWNALGSLATLLGAMPVVRIDVGPGERAELPAMAGY